MILFKSSRIEDEWRSPALDETVREMVEFLASDAATRFSLDITLTCIYRSPEEDRALYHDPRHTPGVHTQWRGVDVSTKGFDWTQAKQLCANGNARWQYDPNRTWMKAFLFEPASDEPGFVSTAAHIHVQSDPPLTHKVELLVDSEIGHAL